ncbi:MAG: CPBP family intramembrane metalloprotease [Phycisphaerales bacterium]|nr:CPBP family intramembrane metalloprotease [Phycisphaerales bacterium]
MRVSGTTAVRLRLWAELLLLFGAMPALIWFRWVPLPVIPAILLFAVLCLGLLLADRSFDRRLLWNGRGLWGKCRVGVLRFCVLAPLMAAALWLWRPGLLWSFVAARPGVWALVMVGYPIASVYGQEVIFRVFMFHRYAPIVPRRGAMVLLSGAAFGWAHVIFDGRAGQWPLLSVGLSAVGGWLFAETYARTRSCAACCVEHTLYGWAVWTLGLGVFFYAGPG